MKCTYLSVVALAVSASAAQGTFVGVQYVQGNSAAATITIGQNAVTFRAYAMFDGLGGVPNGNGTNTENNVNRVQFANINVVGPGTFFQNSALGSDVAPLDFLNSLGPSLRYDSYVTLGVSDAADPLASSISLSPSFSMSTTQILGEWFNNDPPNNVGSAIANSNLGAGFGTFLFQVTVLTNGGSGAFNGTFDPSFPILAAGGNASSVASLISGSFSVVEQGPNGPITHTISIPTPGALALFSVAGLAALRRRR